MSVPASLLNHSKLWTIINKIQANLDLTDERLAQILNIPSEKLISRRETESDLPAMSLFLLADELELNFEDLIQYNFDIDLLKKNYFEILDSIPASYQRCAFSKVFTLTNILKQAEVHGKSQELLHSIQLKRAHLENEYTPISIKIIERAINKVARHFNDDDYAEMGMRNIMKNKNNFFGKTLQDSDNYQAMYEVLFERLSVFVEKNFIYEVAKSTPEYIIVNWLPNPELVEEFKTNHFTTQAMTRFRQAVIEAAALYIGKEKARLTNLKSMDQGDTYYQWRVDFPSSKNLRSQLTI